MFAVAKDIVGEVLWCRFRATEVKRLPRYLQELYQKAFDAARDAYEERNAKLNNVVQFKPSTLQAMLALPAGDEQAFTEAQAQAGSPVENQSARQVQQAVKQWKEVFATVANEFNLFTGEDEVSYWSQSVGESEEDIVIENDSMPIQNSELNSTLPEESEESIDEVASDAPVQSFTDEENNGVELEKKRAETQKLLYEISVLIRSAADTKLDETIRELKLIHAVLNLSCE